MGKHIGKQSAMFDKDIYILETACVAGTKEGEGPLKEYFDIVVKNNLFEEDSWEKAESKMLNASINLCLNKASLSPEEIEYIYSGDLLNQICSSNYAIRDLGIPFLGIFGACSTFGEGLALGAINLESGIGNKVLVSTSSHFCAAEKQFRFPLGLGNQRPPTSTWTVTGAGSAILSTKGGSIKIKRITTGKIVDLGIKDANNMGGAMAPAAADTIISHFKDFNISPDYYDMIYTGDLGYVGKELTIELVKKAGYDISKNYSDCGIEIFDKNTQDTHSGGSGCACSAITFSGMINSKLKKGQLNKVLFIPTGALMNQTSIQQGESIAGIAHAISIEK